MILSIPTKTGNLPELATQMADDVPALFLYRPVFIIWPQTALFQV